MRIAHIYQKEQDIFGEQKMSVINISRLPEGI